LRRRARIHAVNWDNEKFERTIVNAWLVDGKRCDIPKDIRSEGKARRKGPGGYITDNY